MWLAFTVHVTALGSLYEQPAGTAGIATRVDMVEWLVRAFAAGVTANVRPPTRLSVASAVSMRSFRMCSFCLLCNAGPSPDLSGVIPKEASVADSASTQVALLVAGFPPEMGSRPGARR